MTTFINRIAKKAQFALASALIAGSVLAATPLIAGATSGSSTLPCGGADFNADGHVSLADLLIVRRDLGTAKPDGSGMYSVADMLRVIGNFGQTC